jgi:hypothetical protein
LAICKDIINASDYDFIKIKKARQWFYYICNKFSNLNYENNYSRSR